MQEILAGLEWHDRAELVVAMPMLRVKATIFLSTLLSLWFLLSVCTCYPFRWQRNVSRKKYVMGNTTLV